MRVSTGNGAAYLKVKNLPAFCTYCFNMLLCVFFSSSSRVGGIFIHGQRFQKTFIAENANGLLLNSLRHIRQ